MERKRKKLKVVGGTSVSTIYSADPEARESFNQDDVGKVFAWVITLDKKADKILRRKRGNKK